jgi:hypothetical protein
LRFIARFSLSRGAGMSLAELSRRSPLNQPEILQNCAEYSGGSVSDFVIEHVAINGPQRQHYPMIDDRPVVHTLPVTPIDYASPNQFQMSSL